jgi:hypothetical protein
MEGSGRYLVQGTILQSSGVTEENYSESQSGYLVPRPRFEPSAS